MAESSGKTVRGRPFQPGQSGNPGGRPKKTQEEKDALAMIKTLAPRAVEKLEEIINNPKTRPDIALKAVEIILDRTYGKAYANETADSALLQAAKRLLEGVGSAID